MQIDNDLLEEVRKFAMASEKKARYEHSIRVAETACLICGFYGLDAKKGYFAGLSHDICKDMSDEDLLKVAENSGKPYSQTEREHPSLLHGMVAAEKLHSDFGIEDKDILEAVANHTLGKENMGNLAKVVYIADKIEPLRPQSSENYRFSLLTKGIDRMCLAVVQENLSYLNGKGKLVSPATLRFRDYLLEKLGEAK